MFRCSRFALNLVWLVTLAAASPVPAADLFDSTDNGGYTESGTHTPSNEFITTGFTLELRNFFTFDLTSAAGKVATSATLEIDPVGTFNSSLATRLYRVFDYDLPVADLVAGTAGFAGYTDLGSGDLYGELNVPSQTPGSSGGPMPAVSIPLSASALSDINALLAGGSFDFAIGGECQCVTTESLWANSGDGSHATLVLELESVPAAVLPPAVPLALGALLVCALLVQLRNRTA